MALLDPYEESLLAEALDFLREEFPGEVSRVRERFDCVRQLAEAINRFPRVEGVQRIGDMVRDERNLISVLEKTSPSSRLLHMPTRIVAARGLLVAKSHAFSLLPLLTSSHPELQASIRRVIFSIICVLMAEDVYISCLKEESFSQKKKDELSNDLFLLWNSGSDPRSSHYAPALEELWKARNSSPPSFGTMEGSSELIRISMDIEHTWQDFIVQRINHDQTRWALEEFLFGLSYEEITELRARLRRFGISAVSYQEVPSFLEGGPAYTKVVSNDPRAIYDFYVDRRDAAFMRKRTGARGPENTLEELYLKYHIALE
ncbi:MAG: hypothetical protein LBK64_02930 [Spirochaetaceae bacterium]|jgi:hypothetical protein|nr:hypothetical protein [Spirochaetaceae bacterium]